MTTLDLARRFLGIKEREGGASTPIVLAMIQRMEPSYVDTSTPWCSAFVGFVCWLLGLPASTSLAARSWLLIGAPVKTEDAQPGDVVILMRGAGAQPGPSVIKAPGHVGFVDHFDGKFVHVLGGNTNDKIDIAVYPLTRVLGVRRLTV